MIGRLKDLLCILFIAALFWIFFLIDPPQDLGDMGMSLFSNDEVMLKAHLIDKKPFIDVISQYGSIKEGGLALAYYQNNFAYPLGAAVLHIITLLFGLSPYNAIFLELVCAFIAVVLSFYLGKLLMGRFYGIIFAILLCINVYFNINMRTGTSFIVMTVPLVLGAVYFFLKAHHIKSCGSINKWLSIIISSIFLALCYFNGYPISYPAGLFIVLFFLFLIIIAILVKFGVLNRNYQDYRLLHIGCYLIFAILSISLYFLLTLGWDRYNNAPPFTTVKTSLSVNMNRYAGLPASFDETKKNTMKVLDTYFVDMDRGGHFTLGGVHSDTSFDGVAILPPILTLFFLIGIITICKKRRQADIVILLFFLLTSAILIFPIRPYAPRVFVFSTPFLLAISSVGIIEAVRLCLVKTRLNRNRYASAGIQITLIGVILLTTGFSSYNMVHYTFMRERGGNKLWYAGQVDLYDFLKKDGINNKDLVILGGSRDIYIWLEPIIANRQKVDSMLYQGVKAIGDDFNNWLIAQFKDYRRVYFVFPSEYYRIMKPGFNYSQYGMKTTYSSFLDANPNIQPAKTVYDGAGLPMHYVYRLDKDSVSLRHLEITSDKDDTLKIATSIENYVQYISVRGPAKALIFKNGRDIHRIPLDTTENMEMYLNFNGESLLEFYPNFESEKDAFVNVFTTQRAGRSSIRLVEGRGGFNWLEIAPGFVDGFLVYKLELPYKITKLDLRTNPRIFNDYLKRNRFTSYISIDDKDYKKIYEVQSNGNERYGRLSPADGRGGDRDTRIDCAGFNEYSTYDVLYPDSKTVYVKFNPHSQWRTGDAQLISHNKTFIFKARIDTSALKKPLIKNGTEIFLEKGDSPTEAKIIITLADNSQMDSRLVRDTTGATEEKKNNMIENGDFEMWSDSKTPSSWQVIGQVVLEDKRLIRFNGEHSLKINGVNGDAIIRYPLEVDERKPLNGKIVSFSVFVKTRVTKSVRLGISENFISDCFIPKGWVSSECDLIGQDNEIKHGGNSSLKLGGFPYPPHPNVQYTWRPPPDQDLSGKEITFSSYINSVKPDIIRLKITEVYPEGEFIPVGWGLGGGATVFRDKDRKSNGNYSAKLSGAPVGYGNMNLFIRDGVERLRGKTVTFLVNVLSAVADSCQIRLSEYAENDIIVGENFSNFHSGSNKWETLKVSRVFGNDAKGMQIAIFNKNNYTNSFVWVDNAILLVKSESREGEIFIQNGGFEEWTIKSTEEQKARDGEIVENYSEFHPGNGEWQTIVVWHVLENTPKEVRLSIVNQGGEGDFIYADDANLVVEDPLSDKMAEELEDMLENGGFEDWNRIANYEHNNKMLSGFNSGGNNWEFLQVKKTLRPFKAPVYFDINVSNIPQNDSIIIDDAVLRVE